MQKHVAVLDYGSQYSQLIVRRIRELGYFSKLYSPADLPSVGKVSAVILSGGPRSVFEAGAPDVDGELLKQMNTPVLGICYGMQLLAKKMGGAVAPSPRREYGPVEIQIVGQNSLFAGLPVSFKVWMSHSDSVTALPDQSRLLAKSSSGHPAAIQWDDKTYGIQFHPEVSHTEHGETILKNFLALTKQAPDFSMKSFKSELIESIRETVRGRTVVCGVSGGVDSTVLAVLLKESGVSTRAIFVDNGLLRKNEAKEVLRNFEELGVRVELVSAEKIFLDALKPVADPERKREIIGNTFLKVFAEAAGTIDLLAQGTLYPDVIESATGGSGITSRIKTHHNRVDAVMNLKREGKVIEPLSELFKDEVRELGRILRIPESILSRHPFPGPGLAVRIPGPITREQLGILREADDILIHILKERNWYSKIWQALCVLLPVRTVGVKGDERTYEYALSVRCVTSRDAMTADWSELPPEILREISNTILNRVKGVNRVLYDISTKPPAGIEWE